MYRGYIAVGVALMVSLSAVTALGQCGYSIVPTYAPVAPVYNTYYAPAPHVSYYAPSPYVTHYAPVRPYVGVYYAPRVRPYVSYYRGTRWGGVYIGW